MAKPKLGHGRTNPIRTAQIQAQPLLTTTLFATSSTVIPKSKLNKLEPKVVPNTLTKKMAKNYTVDTTGFKLVPASPDQDLEATKREWTEWGHPLLTQEQFITREQKVLAPTEFSKTRRRRWVLVSDDNTDTLDFHAACETYRRPIMVAYPGEEQVNRGFAYSICSVFVPKHKRAFGYGGKMMSLLQGAISPNGKLPLDIATGSTQGATNLIVPLETDSDDGKRYGGDATASFLYSDVGEYYHPFGWRIVGNRHLEWSPSATSSAQLPPNAQWLTPEELPRLGRIDSQYLLETLSQPSSNIRFAVEDPEATSWRWLITRSMFYADTLIPAGQPRPDKFGLLIPGTQGSHHGASYAVWMFDFIEQKISILRLKFESRQALEQLIEAIRQQAHRFNMNKVTAWNVDLKSLDVELTQEDEQQLQHGSKVDAYRPQLADGIIVERSGRKASLPGLAFYGDRKEGQQIEWVCNEYGWWC